MIILHLWFDFGSIIIFGLIWKILYFLYILIPLNNMFLARAFLGALQSPSIQQIFLTLEPPAGGQVLGLDQISGNRDYTVPVQTKSIGFHCAQLHRISSNSSIRFRSGQCPATFIVDNCTWYPVTGTIRFRSGQSLSDFIANKCTG